MPMKGRKLLVLSSICLILILFTISLLSACAKPAPAPTPSPTPAPAPTGKTYNWRMAQAVSDPDNVRPRTANRFIDNVTKASNGRIKITGYWGDQLGDWTVMNELVSKGSLEISMEGRFPGLDQKLNAEFMTSLFTDWDSAAKAFKEPGGWLNKVMAPLDAGVNMKLLAVLNPGFVGVGMKQGKVPSIASVDAWLKDAGNIKIRCEPSKIMEKYSEAMGFKVQVIPYSELYTALQTGVVEGWVGGVLSDSYIWADILKHFINVRCRIDNENFMINLPLWNSLDKADQDILSNAAIEAQNWEWTAAQGEEKSWEDKAKAKGMEIINPPKAIMDEIVKRDRENGWVYAETLIGKGVVDQIRAAAAAAAK